MDEEEDTPIMEIPVHISKRLSEKLYLYQYVNKFPEANMNKALIQKCSIKPQNQEVNLEIGMATHSINYDTSKGEQIAVNADGITGLLAEKNKEETNFFDSGIMDKQMITSTKAVSDCSTYAIGILSQNEIHLTPIKSILQLRPDLEYLDKSDKRHQKSQKAAEMTDEEGAEDAAANVDKEPQKVTVKFARNETERNKKAREQSFAHFSKKSAEEPWINTNWYHIGDCQSEMERMSLQSGQTQDVLHTLSLERDVYMRHLVPPGVENFDAPVLPSDASVSLATLKALPLVDQCRTLFKDAKILTFQQLSTLLGIDISKRDELLNAVPQVAVLVRGLWVVRSELLYPPNTFSATCGVPADAMCRSRDYVLYLFTTSEYVNRRSVAVTVKIPAEELRDIFNGISKHEIHKGWRLLLPNDEQFIARYPDVVQRQQLYWETRSRKFSDYLRDFHKPVRHRKKSHRDSAGSDVDVAKFNGVHKRDNSVSSDTDSGTERNRKSPSVPRKRTKLNSENNAHLYAIQKTITSE